MMSLARAGGRSTPSAIALGGVEWSRPPPGRARGWEGRPAKERSRVTYRLKQGKGQAHGYGQGGGGLEKCPHGSHTHGRRLKITSCSASARMRQTARPLETSSQRTGGAMLMAVLEGRAPNRRPHHAIEVAVTSCRQPRIDETSGPRGDVGKIYVDTISFTHLGNPTPCKQGSS